MSVPDISLLLNMEEITSLFHQIAINLSIQNDIWKRYWVKNESVLTDIQSYLLLCDSKYITYNLFTYGET